MPLGTVLCCGLLLEGLPGSSSFGGEWLRTSCFGANRCSSAVHAPSSELLIAIQYFGTSW